MKKITFLSFLLSIVISSFGQRPVFIAKNIGAIYQYVAGDTAVPTYVYLSAAGSSATMVEGGDGQMYGLMNRSQYDSGEIKIYNVYTNTFTTVVPFNSNVGTFPNSDLLPVSNYKFYGTTSSGGTHNGGTIFSYQIGDIGLKKETDLPAGASPYGTVMQASDGKLYGMTNGDGVDTGGTIYSFDMATSAYTVLHNFLRLSQPYGMLTQGGPDTLYGITKGSGPILGTVPQNPVIFSYVISTHTYTQLDTLPKYTYPQGTLLRASDGNLYGVTLYGGINNNDGMLFRYNCSAHHVDTLYSFNNLLYDGTEPECDLMQASDGMIYGFTYWDGYHSSGVIFKYDITNSAYSIALNFPNGTGVSGGTGPRGKLNQYKFLPVRRHPAPVTTCAGNAVNFISVDSTRGATAQWQLSTDGGVTYANITGATDTLYTMYATPGDSGKMFRTVFMHGGLSDTSLSAMLHVWHQDTTQVYVTGCNGQPVVYHSQTYTSSGTYLNIYRYTGSHSCDSIIVLHVSILPSAADTLHATTCWPDTYPFWGNNYIVSGTYTDTVPGAAGSGCDSFHTLVLNVSQPAYSNIPAVICPGTSYTVGSHVYTTSGSYTDTLNSVNGCDSIVVLSLAVLDSSLYSFFALQPSGVASLYYAINQCAGNQISYQWSWGDGTADGTGDTPTHIYAAAGYYTICVTVTDSMGCAATYCDSNQYMYKNASQMVELKVVLQSPNGISSINAENLNISDYSGAVHFSEALPAPTDLKLYDLSGRVVMREDNFSGKIWSVNSDIASGTYLIQLRNGTNNISKKLIIIH